MSPEEETSNDLKRAKQALVFCCLILFVNILALIIIICSEHLRRTSKFHIITSICVLNICSCMIYFPLSVHHTLHGPGHLGVQTVSFLQTSAYFVHPSIVGLSVTVIGIDHLFNLSDFGSTILVSLMGIALPWLYGLVAYLPCLYQQIILDEAFHKILNNSFAKIDNGDHGLEFNSSTLYMPNVSWKSRQHLPTVSKSSIALTIILWGVVPIVTVTAINLSASVIRCVSNSNTPIESSIPLEPWDDLPVDQLRTRPSCIFEFVFSALVFVGGNVPLLYDLIHVLSCDSTGVCVLSRPTDYTYALLRWAVSFLLPAVWLLDLRFREAIIVTWSRMCMKMCIVY